jgi:hypothetical protein
MSYVNGYNLYITVNYYGHSAAQIVVDVKYPESFEWRLSNTFINHMLFRSLFIPLSLFFNLIPLNSAYEEIFKRNIIKKIQELLFVFAACHM